MANSDEIISYYNEHDTRERAHRSLLEEWIPAHVRRPGFSQELQNFAYGDTPGEIFLECLEWAQVGLEDRFIDLGCGCGLPTLLAAGHCGKCVGIDLLGGILDWARAAAKLLRIENATFLQQDISSADLAGFSLAYVTATRFTKELLDNLTPNLESLPSGARLISVSHCFKSRQLRLLDRRQRRFSWGTPEELCTHELYLLERI